MSSRKKNKLSLKEKDKKKEHASNSIISMFKKQEEKQAQESHAETSKCDKEDDVEITKIVKSKSGTIMGCDVGCITSKHLYKECVKEHKLSKSKEKQSRGKEESTTNLIENKDEGTNEQSDSLDANVAKSKLRKRKSESKNIDLQKHQGDGVCSKNEDEITNDEEDVICRNNESMHGNRSKRRRLSLRKSKLKTEDASKKIDVIQVVAECSNTETTDSSLTSEGDNAENVSSLSKTNTILARGNKCVEDDNHNDVSDEAHLTVSLAGSGGENVFNVMLKQSQTNKSSSAINFTLKENNNNIDNDDSDDDGGSVVEKEGSAYRVPYDGVTVVEEKEGSAYRVPYYLENFQTILDTVMSYRENDQLFDDTDQQTLAAFNQLSESCQKLYIRIFSRKLAWLPMSKLKYPEIGDDIPHLVDQLVQAGLLQSGDVLTDLQVILKTLSAPDLKALGKSFHLNVTGQTKKKLVEMLMKKSQQSCISSMFTGGRGISTHKTMIDRAKVYLGMVCRLVEAPRAVFIRVLMLFSLFHTNLDDDGSGGGQNQLFQMLMANIGRVLYPNYTVNRQTPIFKDRAALVRFETALQWEMDLHGKIETSKWNDAYDLYLQARAVGKEVCENKDYLKWDAGLPEFLRLYTAGSVYARIDSMGVEVYQRRKMYREAVELLEYRLAQPLYCPHVRGHWYERLALNLDAHLKSPGKCLDAIKRGLAEPAVRSARRLAIYERAKKVCTAPKSKYADRMSEFVYDEVRPTPEVCIEGMVMSDATQMGMKYQFIMEGGTDGVTLCAVEEFVLEHYKHHGYPEGIHAEGSIISNLFVLLFWDIMFMDVEDVFQGPFQSSPLDMATPDFYRSRTDNVDERLHWIKSSPIEDLTAEVARIFEEYSGTMCAGINWDRFPGPEKHQGLVQCMGGEAIAGILERYVKDPRHTRSGFPDLTLWNTDSGKWKICEVKGPGDRLSYKQILWIDYLLKLGVDAEVCYVKAVASKRLKPSTSKT